MTTLTAGNSVTLVADTAYFSVDVLVPDGASGRVENGRSLGFPSELKSQRYSGLSKGQSITFSCQTGTISYFESEGPVQTVGGTLPDASGNVPGGAGSYPPSGGVPLTDLAAALQALIVSRAARLVPTAIQTASSTIAASALALYDTTAGALVGTLPTDPPDGTIVGVRHAAGAPNNLLVQAGGTNKIGTGTATSASLPVNVETSIYQFVTALNAWLTISNWLPAIATPLAVSASRTLTLGDRGNTLSLATGLTMTLPAAGTLGAGYGNGFRLPPSGTMTLSWPTGVTVNGVAGPNTATRTRSGGTNVQVFITPTETADNFDFSGV